MRVKVNGEIYKIPNIGNNVYDIQDMNTFEELWEEIDQSYDRQYSLDEIFDALIDMLSDNEDFRDLTPFQQDMYIAINFDMLYKTFREDIDDYYTPPKYDGGFYR